MPVPIERLSNGLSLLLLPRPGMATVACGFFVRTGVRDEDPALMGVSHFLEHMAFKGTATRSAGEINTAFDAMGADANAWTGHEATAYHAQLLPEFLPGALAILVDMMRPALREEDFATERQVILEEIGMYDDRPEWRLSDAMLEAHYPGHGLGHRVLGTRETVGRMTPAQMRAYFSARYAPDTMALVVAGRFDAAEVREQAGRLTASWTPCGATRRASAAPRTGGGEKTLRDAKCTRHYFGAAWDAPSAGDPRRFAARVLACVLGDDDGSRLYRALTEPGLAEDADFGFSPQDGCGLFTAFAGCDPAKAGEVGRLLENELVAVASGARPVTEDEVARAVNKLATRAALKDERPGGCMQSLGVQWAVAGDSLLPEEEGERLLAVKADEVRDLAGVFLAEGPKTVVRLGP